MSNYCGVEAVNGAQPSGLASVVTKGGFEILVAASRGALASQHDAGS